MDADDPIGFQADDYRGPELRISSAESDSPPASSTYICAACKGTFVTGWTEEEAEAEYRALYPGSAARHAPRDVVCDDCFKRMTAEYPPAQFERELRDEHQ